MIAKKSAAGRPRKVGKPGSNRRKSNLTAPRSHSQDVDVFAQAKQTYTIPDLWRMLGLPGEPKVGMNLSPVREERRPSFSIYDGGRKFKDHGGDGAQGDLIAFVQAATDWNHAEIRDYFIERLGIDRGSGGNNCPHLQERNGDHDDHQLQERSAGHNDPHLETADAGVLTSRIRSGFTFFSRCDVAVRCSGGSVGFPRTLGKYT